MFDVIDKTPGAKELLAGQFDGSDGLDTPSFGPNADPNDYAGYSGIFGAAGTVWSAIKKPDQIFKTLGEACLKSADCVDLSSGMHDGSREMEDAFNNSTPSNQNTSMDDSFFFGEISDFGDYSTYASDYSNFGSFGDGDSGFALNEQQQSQKTTMTASFVDKIQELSQTNDIKNSTSSPCPTGKSIGEFLSRN